MGDPPLIPEGRRRREDVVAWPRVAEAREALETYLDAWLNPGIPLPSLDAVILDFGAQT
jgi:hypothetical protein